jgi:hypothetical protein
MIVRSFPPYPVNMELTLCFPWCSGCRVQPPTCFPEEKLTGRNYAYGPGHPMKPHRIRMCHSLIMNYGLYKNMEIYVPLPSLHTILVKMLTFVQRAKPATKQEMCQFHSDDYIDFLSKVTPENMAAFSTQQTKCTTLSLNGQAKYQLMWVMTVLCLTDFSSFAGFQGEEVWRVQHG